jgi:hypothetical protein
MHPAHLVQQAAAVELQRSAQTAQAQQLAAQVALVTT